jgi:hypothetical protein
MTPVHGLLTLELKRPTIPSRQHKRQAPTALSPQVLSPEPQTYLTISTTLRHNLMLTTTSWSPPYSMRRLEHAILRHRFLRY